MPVLITEIYFEMCTLSYIILHSVFNLNIIFVTALFLLKILIFTCMYVYLHEFIYTLHMHVFVEVAERVKVYGAGVAGSCDPLLQMLGTEPWFSASTASILKC